MIKLTSFYPFSNFLKVTHEFHEDKAIVKKKSLNVEHQFEFDYEDVAEISDKFLYQADQGNFSFWLIMGASLALSLLCIFSYINTIWFRIAQILFASAIFLLCASFVKSWYFVFSDKNNNALLAIRQNRKNRDLILQVIEKIKAKSNILQMTSAAPFPENKPLFEYSYYDIANLEKTVDRFYENEIIGFEKSLVQEMVYRVGYDELSGKINRGKVNNGIFDLTFIIFILILSIASGLRYGFGVSFGIPSLYILEILIAMLAVSWLLKFIKQELFVFYNRNGQVEYWAYINRSEKEKIEEIIKYIQSRIPAKETSKENS